MVNYIILEEEEGMLGQDRAVDQVQVRRGIDWLID